MRSTRCHLRRLTLSSRTVSCAARPDPPVRAAGADRGHRRSAGRPAGAFSLAARAGHRGRRSRRRPERIAMEWWRDERGHKLTRDYFRVESETGVRVWLYREGLYESGEAEQPRWFCTGCSHERMSLRSFGAKRPRASHGEIEPYAELAVTTNFSFLRGASHPEELVKRAQKLGLTGIGIADRNSVAGVVRAHQIRALQRKIRNDRKCCKESPPETIEPDPKLRCRRAACFRRRHARHSRLSADRALGDGSRAALRRQEPRREGRMHSGSPDLLEHIAGLNLIVMPPARSRPRRLGMRFCSAESKRRRRSVWLAASMLYRGDDARRLERLAAIAERAFVPLIAVNDVLYHAPERRAAAGRRDLHPRARDDRTAGRLLEANAERHLKSPREMARLVSPLRRRPSTRRLRFLDRCNFSLDELRKTEYADETAQAMRRRRMRWSPSAKRESRGAIPTDRRQRSETCSTTSSH